MKSVWLCMVLLVVVCPLFGQEVSESSYIFHSGEITLEGILHKPDQSKRLPAIVLIPGDEFDEAGKSAADDLVKLSKDIFLDNGYAVFIVNKRGTGQSSGNWHLQDMHSKAKDAYAAFRFLKSLQFIDNQMVGLVGYDEGGRVAQLTASLHRDVAFVISLGGSVLGLQDREQNGYETNLMCAGLPEAQVDDLLARKEKALDRRYATGRVFPLAEEARYWYLNRNYDHDEALLKLKCPGLMVFAQFDQEVVLDREEEHLYRLFGFRLPDNLKVATIAEADHGFRQSGQLCTENTGQPLNRALHTELKKYLSQLEKLTLLSRK